MIYEFKIFIVIINLVLDVLKNLKVVENKEFIECYLKMIWEENWWMYV